MIFILSTILNCRVKLKSAKYAFISAITMHGKLFYTGMRSPPRPKSKLPKEVPCTIWPPKLLDLFPHAWTLLFKFRDPQSHLINAQRLIVFLNDLRFDEPITALWECMRSMRIVHAVRGKEPTSNGSSQTELLKEEDLDNYSEGQPLILGSMRAGLQRKLLAVHESTKLLTLRVSEPWVGLKWRLL